MREFTRVLEAGQQDRIATSGDYVYFKSGTGEIKIITDDGHAVILQVGHGIRFDKKFKTVDAQNTNAEKATFVLMIGSGDFQNNRIVGKIDVDGGIDVNNIVDVKPIGVVDVKNIGGVNVNNVVNVRPAGGSVAVGAKSVGSLLPVKTYNNIPARGNREKLLINYFNNRPHDTEGLVSVFFIVVKVGGVPFTFFAPYGESGSIEINTTKALTVEFFDNYNNYNYNNNNNNNNYNNNNNNYTGIDMLLSIVEVLND